MQSQVSAELVKITSLNGQTVNRAGFTTPAEHGIDAELEDAKN